MKTQLPEISKPIMNQVSELKTVVSSHFGSRLKYLILYGSYARGDFHQNSDIDLLVVLDDIESEMQEIDTLANLKTDILLDSNIYISTNPVSIEKLENSDLLFYKKIRNEGIIV